ncbi:MAG: CBS domain-containing protein [Gemmatimonadota bacterium]
MSTSTTEIHVGDVMLPIDELPIVSPRTLLKEAIEAMTERGLGVACIVGDGGRLVGIFTDGDMRRMLLRFQKPLAALFADDVIAHAVLRPVTTRADASLREAVETMEERGVWDLPVVDEKGVLTGLLHLHPAVRALLGA